LTHCGAPTAAAVKDRNLKAAKTDQLGKLTFIIALGAAPTQTPPPFGDGVCSFSRRGAY